MSIKFKVAWCLRCHREYPSPREFEWFVEDKAFLSSYKLASPTPPLPSANCLSFSVLCVAGRPYWPDRRGGRERRRSQIIQPHEILVLYKSFNTLCPTASANTTCPIRFFDCVFMWSSKRCIWPCLSEENPLTGFRFSRSKNKNCHFSSNITWTCLHEEWIQGLSHKIIKRKNSK